MTKKITNKRFHGVSRGFTGFHGVSQKILIYLILKIIGVYFDTRKFQSAVSCFPTETWTDILRKLLLLLLLHQAVPLLRRKKQKQNRSLEKHVKALRIAS